MADSAFGKPLINNVLRGHVAEAIIALALEPDWDWCSGDYASWDFQHRRTNLRLEVKQSAARQSWELGAGSKKSSPRFDIAPRTGRWEVDGVFVSEPGRAADLYVFAYHPIEDDTADHRNPMQWTFFVVLTSSLPKTKSIGLKALGRLSGAYTIIDLKQAVSLLASD